MSGSAFERKPGPDAVSTNELVRDYLTVAGARLDALESMPHNSDELWALRNLRWAVHHLLELVEGYRDAS